MSGVAVGERETWQLGEWDEHLGYDCMTGGVHVGPVYLDGADYGQRPCQPIRPEDKARLLADARLIAAAHDMFEALKEARETIRELVTARGSEAEGSPEDWTRQIDAALAKATTTDGGSA